MIGIVFYCQGDLAGIHAPARLYNKREACVHIVRHGAKGFINKVNKMSINLLAPYCGDAGSIGGEVDAQGYATAHRLATLEKVVADGLVAEHIEAGIGEILTPYIERVA